MGMPAEAGAEGPASGALAASPSPPGEALFGDAPPPPPPPPDFPPPLNPTPDTRSSQSTAGQGRAATLRRLLSAINTITEDYMSLSHAVPGAGAQTSSGTIGPGMRDEIDPWALWASLAASACDVALVFWKERNAAVVRLYTGKATMSVLRVFLNSLDNTDLSILPRNGDGAGRSILAGSAQQAGGGGNERAIQSLVDMGFDRRRVEVAMWNTGSTSVELAMEWLLQHRDGEGGAAAAAGSTAAAQESAGAAAPAAAAAEEKGPAATDGESATGSSSKAKAAPSAAERAGEELRVAVEAVTEHLLPNLVFVGSRAGSEALLELCVQLAYMPTPISKGVASAVSSGTGSGAGEKLDSESPSKTDAGDSTTVPPAEGAGAEQQAAGPSSQAMRQANARALIDLLLAELRRVESISPPGSDVWVLPSGPTSDEQKDTAHTSLPFALGLAALLLHNRAFVAATLCEASFVLLDFVTLTSQLLSRSLQQREQGLPKTWEDAFDQGYDVLVGNLALPSACTMRLPRASKPADWFDAAFLVLHEAVQHMWLVPPSVSLAGLTPQTPPKLPAELQESLVGTALDTLALFPRMSGGSAIAVLLLLRELCSVPVGARRVASHKRAGFILEANGAVLPAEGGGLALLLRLPRHGRFPGLLRLVNEIFGLLIEDSDYKAQQMEDQLHKLFASGERIDLQTVVELMHSWVRTSPELLEAVLKSQCQVRTSDEARAGGSGAEAAAGAEVTLAPFSQRKPHRTGTSDSAVPPQQVLHRLLDHLLWVIQLERGYEKLEAPAAAAATSAQSSSGGDAATTSSATGGSAAPSSAVPAAEGGHGAATDQSGASPTKERGEGSSVPPPPPPSQPPHPLALPADSVVFVLQQLLVNYSPCLSAFARVSSSSSNTSSAPASEPAASDQGAWAPLQTKPPKHPDGGVHLPCKVLPACCGSKSPLIFMMRRVLAGGAFATEPSAAMTGTLSKISAVLAAAAAKHGDTRTKVLHECVGFLKHLANHVEASGGQASCSPRKTPMDSARAMELALVTDDGGKASPMAFSAGIGILCELLVSVARPYIGPATSAGGGGSGGGAAGSAPGATTSQQQQQQQSQAQGHVQSSEAATQTRPSTSRGRANDGDSNAAVNSSAGATTPVAAAPGAPTASTEAAPPGTSSKPSCATGTGAIGALQPTEARTLRSVLCRLLNGVNLYHGEANVLVGQLVRCLELLSRPEALDLPGNVKSTAAVALPPHSGSSAAGEASGEPASRQQAPAATSAPDVPMRAGDGDEDVHSEAADSMGTRGRGFSDAAHMTIDVPHPDGESDGEAGGDTPMLAEDHEEGAGVGDGSEEADEGYDEDGEEEDEDDGDGGEEGGEVDDEGAEEEDEDDEEVVHGGGGGNAVLSRSLAEDGVSVVVDLGDGQRFFSSSVGTGMQTSRDHDTGRFMRILTGRHLHHELESMYVPRQIRDWGTAPSRQTWVWEGDLDMPSHPLLHSHAAASGEVGGEAGRSMGGGADTFIQIEGPGADDQQHHQGVQFGGTGAQGQAAAPSGEAPRRPGAWHTALMAHLVATLPAAPALPTLPPPAQEPGTVPTPPGISEAPPADVGAAGTVQSIASSALSAAESVALAGRAAAAQRGDAQGTAMATDMMVRLEAAAAAAAAAVSSVSEAVVSSSVGRSAAAPDAGAGASMLVEPAVAAAALASTAGTEAASEAPAGEPAAAAGDSATTPVAAATSEAPSQPGAEPEQGAQASAEAEASDAAGGDTAATPAGSEAGDSAQEPPAKCRRSEQAGADGATSSTGAETASSAPMQVEEGGSGRAPTSDGQVQAPAPAPTPETPARTASPDAAQGPSSGGTAPAASPTPASLDYGVGPLRSLAESLNVTQEVVLEAAGIDPQFLEGIPMEMRDEVVFQQLSTVDLSALRRLAQPRSSRVGRQQQPPQQRSQAPRRLQVGQAGPVVAAALAAASRTAAASRASAAAAASPPDAAEAQLPAAAGAGAPAAAEPPTGAAAATTTSGEGESAAPVAEAAPAPAAAAPETASAPVAQATETSTSDAAGESDEIAQDVLDALPPDIRAEVLAQQARERAALQAAAAPASADPAQAQDMDTASFIATLTPELRQEVLLTVTDEVMRTLPPELIAEAQLVRERTFQRPPRRITASDHDHHAVARATPPQALLLDAGASGQWRALRGNGGTTILAAPGGGAGGGGRDAGARTVPARHRGEGPPVDLIQMLRGLMRGPQPAQTQRRHDGRSSHSRGERVAPAPRLDARLAARMDDNSAEMPVELQHITTVCRLLFLRRPVPRALMERLFFNLSVHPACRDAVMRRFLQVIVWNAPQGDEYPSHNFAVNASSAPAASNPAASLMFPPRHLLGPAASSAAADGAELGALEACSEAHVTQQVAGGRVLSYLTYLLPRIPQTAEFFARRVGLSEFAALFDGGFDGDEHRRKRRKADRSAGGLESSIIEERKSGPAGEEYAINLFIRHTGPEMWPGHISSGHTQLLLMVLKVLLVPQAPSTVAASAPSTVPPPLQPPAAPGVAATSGAATAGNSGESGGTVPPATAAAGAGPVEPAPAGAGGSSSSTAAGTAAGAKPQAQSQTWPLKLQSLLTAESVAVLCSHLCMGPPPNSTGNSSGGNNANNGSGSSGSTNSEPRAAHILASVLKGPASPQVKACVREELLRHLRKAVVSVEQAISSCSDAQGITLQAAGQEAGFLSVLSTLHFLLQEICKAGVDISSKAPHAAAGSSAADKATEAAAGSGSDPAASTSGSPKTFLSSSGAALQALLNDADAVRVWRSLDTALALSVEQMGAAAGDGDGSARGASSAAGPSAAAGARSGGASGAEGSPLLRVPPPLLHSMLPVIEAFFLAHAPDRQSSSPAGPSSSSGQTRAGGAGVPPGNNTAVSSSGPGGPLSLREDADAPVVRTPVVCFGERHRRAINVLIRHSPSLLMTSFSPLVDSVPWALEFDNKRHYLRQKLRALRGDLRYDVVRLHVRRSEVFMDSYHQLRMRSGEEMHGKLSITFVGEEAMDAGGVAREWFTILSREIFNPNYGLFSVAGGKACTFHPNRMSYVNPDHLSFFTFIGRIIGKALFDGHHLEAYFTRSFYKHMLRRKVSTCDMEALDPDYYRNLRWMLDNTVSQIFDGLTFTAESDDFGRIRTVELKPGGAQIAVTDENKKEYVQLMCEHKMTTSVQKQISAFLSGFHELVPPHLISLFDDKELELLISGLPEIDINDLRQNTDYHNYTENSPQIQWFWKALGEFSTERKAWFLQFVTGTSQVPIEGFKGLIGMRGPQKFSIHKAEGGERLPTAHTCFNQLDLPEYDSEEKMAAKLIQAVNEAHEGFGFV